jgi:L-amino acid N-acyltransferase YncA
MIAFPTMLRPATPADAAAICAVYNPYVRDTTISFEETFVTAADMAERIVDTTRRYPWLVAEGAGGLLGYAYASQWRTRSAYRFAVETTVYVAPEAPRRGVGTALYRALLDTLRAEGFHCAMGGIALPNPASVALHEKLGFRQVAQFREVGWKFDRRVDVGYWQLLLARAGTDAD